jgi:hypothetical protein
MRAQQRGRRRKIRRRFDGNNVAAQVAFLGGQNCFHIHGSLPPPEVAGSTRDSGVMGNDPAAAPVPSRNKVTRLTRRGRIA